MPTLMLMLMPTLMLAVLAAGLAAGFAAAGFNRDGLSIRKRHGHRGLRRIGH
nr:hypothetical protein [Pseudomonas tolaasii]